MVLAFSDAELMFCNNNFISSFTIAEPYLNTTARFSSQCIILRTDRILRNVARTPTRCNLLCLLTCTDTSWLWRRQCTTLATKMNCFNIPLVRVFTVVFVPMSSKIQSCAIMNIYFVEPVSPDIS